VSNVVKLSDYRDSAEEINREHQLAQSEAASSVRHAIRCGELLIAQKAALKHGEFKKWVAGNCEFSYKTAAVYMKAAGQKSSALDFSSLRQVIRNSAKPKTRESVRMAAQHRELGTHYSWVNIAAEEGFLKSNKTGGSSQRAKAILAKSYPGLQVSNPAHEDRLRAACQELAAKLDPDLVIDVTQKKIDDARDEIDKSDRERFDNAVVRARKAAAVQAKAEYHRKADIEVESLFYEREEWLDRREAEIESRWAGVMTKKEFNFVRDLLDPANHPGEESRYKKAISIFDRLGKAIGTR
jgi:hypothetical protein